MEALFPHHKLDWTISRLEDRVHASPDDPALRVELARAVLSRGLYHAGGEKECNRALALARKALNDDPANVEALVLAGLSLVGMERPRGATRYLDQALRIDGERADLRLALGRLYALEGEPGQGVRQLESACRAAPDSWETHLELGRVLMQLARRQTHSRRLIERAQYHLVQALRREPSPDQSAPLLKDLGVSCMLTGRHREAEKFFIRLREHPKHSAAARYHLGQVAYALGKYNNAIQHFRQYLRERPEDPQVLARTAMAWFQLGEYARAREACHQALMGDPENIDAQHALGCTLLEEGEPNEAVRVFREALKEHPDHMPTYVEMARTRRLGGDVHWLMQALSAEVGNYDRMAPGGDTDARQLTRSRVHAILEEMRAVGPSTAGAILTAIEHTQDEALRFQLWEAACALSTAAVADGAASRLREAGKYYGPGLGGVALAVAEALPEPVLTAGLRLDEADVKRAAVDRHGPAHDVQAHRRNLDTERNRARAHQALLLLAVGVRRSAAGRELLRRWAAAADPELATAAWAGLAMYGDPGAAGHLHSQAAPRSATAMVERLLTEVTPPSRTRTPRRVSDDEEARCTTCGRQPGEVTHMMAGGDTVVCDRCVVQISRNRAGLAAPDDASCGLCGRTHFEASGLYRYNEAEICSQCMQLSLGLLEREEVDRFLATW